MQWWNDNVFVTKVHLLMSSAVNWCPSTELDGRMDGLLYFSLLDFDPEGGAVNVPN